jgi:NAD(P)-dependent dehydrogenase (short-subunit alcohol dehydrogenase family)
MRFKDQTVVVIGGASGIGARTAERFAEDGAKVVVVDRNLGQVAGVAASLIADVTDPVTLKDAFDAAEANGPIKVVVNAAGISARAKLIVDFDPRVWMRTIEVNLLGSMLVGAESVRRMAKTGGGSIVYVSSNVARRGLPYRSDYVASKWGLLGLTQTLALEAVEHGIRVNAVCPGPVDTPLLWEVVDYHAEIEGKTREEVAEAWRVSAPMKRFIETDEVADVIMFLASDASSAMTGQALNITGGFIMT